VATASREAIYSALFDRLAEAYFPIPIMGNITWMGMARKWIDPAQIPSDQQPFLCQSEGGVEDYTWQGPGFGPKRILTASLFGFCRVNSGDGQELGSTYLTSMLEAIENALAPDTLDRGTCSLGGIVIWARIEGKILKVPGDLDPQALLLVPIRIEIP
jgi:hypothetical protein